MSTWPELDAGNKKEIKNQQVVKTTASDTSVDRLIERVLQKKTNRLNHSSPPVVA